MHGLRSAAVVQRRSCGSHSSASTTAALDLTAPVTSRVRRISGAQLYAPPDRSRQPGLTVSVSVHPGVTVLLRVTLRASQSRPGMLVGVVLVPPKRRRRRLC
jgi:hypothetical protein